MIRLQDVVHPMQDETLVLVARTHPLAVAPALVGAGLCIILPSFFLFRLFQQGILGMILALGLPLIGIILAIAAVREWDATMMILTTQRVISVRQTQIWKRFVREVALETVQIAEAISEGWYKTLIGMGTVRLRSAQGVLDVPHIWRPTRVAQRIQTQRHGPPKHAPMKPLRHEEVAIASMREDESVEDQEAVAEDSEYHEDVQHVDVQDIREHIHEKIDHLDAETLEKIEHILERTQGDV